MRFLLLGLLCGGAGLITLYVAGKRWHYGDEPGAHLLVLFAVGLVLTVAGVRLVTVWTGP